jgi:hypothetical protein
VAGWRHKQDEATNRCVPKATNAGRRQPDTRFSRVLHREAICYSRLGERPNFDDSPQRSDRKTGNATLDDYAEGIAQLGDLRHVSATRPLQRPQFALAATYHRHRFHCQRLQPSEGSGGALKELRDVEGFTIFLGVAEELGVAFGVVSQPAALGLILLMLGFIQTKIFSWRT